MTWTAESLASSIRTTKAKAAARKALPLPDFVRATLAYDALSGRFFRLGKACGKGTRNDFGVGSICRGYLAIRVRGQRIGAHRLAWIHHYGCEPDGIVDHINGNTLDNRIVNLRVVDRVGHAVNRTASSQSRLGVKGVHFHRGANRFRAQFAHAGRRKHLGYFDTVEQAKAAYDAYSLRVHGSLSEAYRAVAP